MQANPRNGHGKYDWAQINVTCLCCDYARSWEFPRNILIASVLEIRKKRSEDLDSWLDDLLADSCSYLCHNSASSDPFHALKEPLVQKPTAKLLCETGPLRRPRGTEMPARILLGRQQFETFQSVRAEGDLEESAGEPRAQARLVCSTGPSLGR